MPKGFEGLKLWERSIRLSVDVYNALYTCREYSIRDQIIRSAISIPARIAEGFERDSAVDFIRFLTIARGTAGELRTQLYVAAEVRLCDVDALERLLKEAAQVSAMISAEARKRADEVKEKPAGECAYCSAPLAYKESVQG